MTPYQRGEGITKRLHNIWTEARAWLKPPSLGQIDYLEGLRTQGYPLGIWQVLEECKVARFYTPIPNRVHIELIAAGPIGPAPGQVLN